MKTKITKRSVDALAAPETGEAMLWDTEIAGFGVRCRPGGGKVYIVMYRPGAGGRAAPLRKFTIGRHGSPWTPEQARDEAKRILGRVANGDDPAAVKRELRAAETITDLSARFLADHVAPKRKERTGSEYARLLDRVILPSIGNLTILELNRAHVAKLHNSLRKTPYQANRCLALISKMITLAEAWGLRPEGTNPAKHVERFPETARERMLSQDELARLGTALEAYSGLPYVPAAIRLLLFTGARLNEILGLQWVWIDFERHEARLPDSKSGKKTLHLPPPAMAVLAELPKIEGNPHVICGQVAGKSLVNLEKPWRSIRNAAGLLDVRLHDFRHAFASTGASNGEGLYIIGKLLGHSQTSTTQRYAHLAADPIKAAGASIATKIEAALRANPIKNDAS